MSTNDGKKRWLVTGAAGFVGSHLVQALVEQGHQVVGLDNLSSGKWENLEGFLKDIPNGTRKNFVFMCEDIRDSRMVEKAVRGADVILHHAAMASVPQSIENPLEAHEINATGFLNILEAARANNVKRVVYASSSAVYGDNQEPVKSEKDVGNLLSPYAVTKLGNELYADQFHQHYGMETIGFRYFNIFGLRQDPAGAYAAVIPKWVEAIKGGQPLIVNGDGSTTRDFVHVSDVVSINIKAGLISANEGQKAFGQAFNICGGQEISLKNLIQTLSDLWLELKPGVVSPGVEHREFRPGDIHRSCGNAQKARDLLGYKPTMTLKNGLRELLLGEGILMP
ncbi:MAG: GDP-mannose 4,6-dehydratase [Bdellovibrionaceae bacterium]|nr:GDP-mannose 4,6-dehydratase [Bdellovibrionales bacterium]MCB9086700.1 GDP-mannose 4,6-dehydratase [Pseudobdellovibrionaceae bacterium]